MLLIGGLQFIFLGVMGEYIGRIYSEAKDRPLFLIMEELGFDEAKAARPGEGSEPVVIVSAARTGR